SLVRVHVPPHAAVYIVYSFFVGSMILITLFFLPFTWNRLAILINDLPRMVEQLRDLLLLLPQRYPDIFTVDQVQRWIDTMQSGLGRLGQTLLSYSFSSATRIATWAVYTVLVPIMVFFMMRDSEKLLNWLEIWLPERRPVMAQIWHEMNDQLANYIRGKALEILIVGFCSFVLFSLLGLHYAPLLSVLVGFSVIIPFIGATLV